MLSCFPPALPAELAFPLSLCSICSHAALQNALIQGMDPFYVPFYRYFAQCFLNYKEKLSRE